MVLILFLGSTGIVGEIDLARAEETDNSWVSKVISVQGRIAVKRSGDSEWQPARLNDTLFGGDQLRVEANSRAGIVLRNDAVLRLDQNTTLVFTEIEKETTFIFRLLRGAANFFSRRPRSLKVLTPFVNGVVEGTEFYVQVGVDRTRIDLFEGRLLAFNPYGETQLSGGQGVTAMEGSAPRVRLLVRPRESVQWAIYYSPVLAVGAGDTPHALQDAVQAYDKGRILEALNDLNQVAEDSRDSQFYTLRAALLLHNGSISRAQDDITQALFLNPEYSEAFALRAIIAVVQNRSEEAMGIAQNAVRLNPDSAAAHLALSYAYQAAFDLNNALEAARTAVARVPENATAHARLAELRLSLGKRKAGVQSARKAVEINPNSSHANAMLGFAYLTQINIGKARNAFEKSIALDSAAPMPRLGLGLAKIRDGDLAQGRAEIEIAAGLDPLNALIRSYLGKAYFDEKRGPLDETQFDIAKSLDPKDPTPWFYDAIRKQTLNRPGEAVQDLQESIKRNNNRAIYRSRLLLDEDLAARSAALGRIYIDLSFQEKALREGARSLRTDPANYSAHRLLADVYASRPRHEISQVSELLQSQLLQPLNLTPVPPQSAENTLVVSEHTGPPGAAFNEFNPLFTRDRLTFQLGGAVGDNAAWSDDVSAAGLYKRLSFSAGHYHFETEGFRPNNDLEKDIYNSFIQAALSPRTSIQLEYRQKEVFHGDLELRFDPQDFSDSQRITRDEKIPRFGFHHAVDERHHFIGSIILNNTEYTLFKRQVGGPGPFGPVIAIEEREEEDDAYNAEGQYLYKGNRLNLAVGAGYYEQNIEQTVSTLVTSGPITLLDLPNQRTDVEVWHANAYAYALLEAHAKLDVTVGVSGDVFSKGEVEPRQINPKFGFNWYLTPALTVRGAAFRSFKRSLVTSQTVEPTQVAGFVQFFDDYGATDAKRYGLGLDWQLAEKTYCGTEVTHHDMTHPRESAGTGAIRDEEHMERHHRAYLYWLPRPQVAVSAEYLFDDYERGTVWVDSTRPFKLRTHALPLTVAYFHPSGMFLKTRGTYFNQQVETLASTTSDIEIQRDSFSLIDATIGYRLPRRYGIITFTVSNLLDTEFNFQDTNFLSPKEEYPLIRPERQYCLKATLRY
jgi:tetratricopeptide (TPR) repeat protein